MIQTCGITRLIFYGCISTHQREFSMTIVRGIFGTAALSELAIDVPVIMRRQWN
ncbi:MAG: hypothetical protein WA364_12280 [Candidatus Nitrosopolaris sp.]